MERATLMMLAVPTVIAVLWYIAAPLIVSAGNPRVRQRNPDHFSRLVRLNRIWGSVAVAVGFVIAFIR